ncbi:hypothetical protein C8R43DRAFT_1238890 [Mycena crocata]|nr:hypothetical protein C8R43DRAFT_1238890 [Mycena crocata]
MCALAGSLCSQCLCFYLAITTMTLFSIVKSPNGAPLLLPALVSYASTEDFWRNRSLRTRWMRWMDWMDWNADRLTEQKSAQLYARR